jgi:hypothetical protein
MGPGRPTKELGKRSVPVELDYSITPGYWDKPFKGLAGAAVGLVLYRIMRMIITANAHGGSGLLSFALIFVASKRKKTRLIILSFIRPREKTFHQIC